VLVPNDDPVGRQAGGQQSAHDGGDHGGPRAGQRAGLGKDLDADGVVGVDEAAPSFRDVGGAGQGEQTGVEGGGYAIIVREKGGLQAEAVHLDHLGQVVRYQRREDIRRRRDHAGQGNGEPEADQPPPAFPRPNRKAMRNPLPRKRERGLGIRIRTDTAMSVS